MRAETRIDRGRFPFPGWGRSNTLRRMSACTAARRLLGRRPERLWSWVLVGCLLLFVAAVRWRLRDMPLERDEGEYAYTGQLLLQGILPGKLAYSMKLPGTHVAYAILMALFGQSSAGIHFGFLLVNAATILPMFLFARALAGAVAGVVAAATYALCSLSTDTLGTAGHATHFVVLFGLGGLLLLWHASKTGRWAAYLGSGLLLGCSVLTKHNGLVLVAFGASWLVWLELARSLGPKATLLKAGSMYLLGAVLPLLLLVLVFWCAGTLKTYWFWAVTYAQAYAKPNPGWTLVWRIMRQRMPAVIDLPFAASFLGLIVFWLRPEFRREASFATGFLLVSMLAVVPGLHFRPHYYVLLLP